MATVSKSKLQNFIDGERVDAADGATEEVVNPANGEVIAEMPLSTEEDVNRAVAAAKDAFDGWARTTPGQRAAAINERLGRLDETAWQKSGRFLFGGTPVWEAPIGEMIWGFLFDAIHHRGQLSTYLRPMGGKVPAIYGPSGDDSGQ